MICNAILIIAKQRQGCRDFFWIGSLVRGFENPIACQPFEYSINLGITNDD